MKIMVATDQTQGDRSNDFNHATPGEIVRFGSECDGERVDGKCGCRRALIGCDSNMATTTFLVVDRPHLDKAMLYKVVKESMKKAGWIGHSWSTEAEDAKWVREDATELARIANCFEVGAIVERRGTKLNVRAYRERVAS